MKHAYNDKYHFIACYKVLMCSKVTQYFRTAACTRVQKTTKGMNEAIHRSASSCPSANVSRQNKPFLTDISHSLTKAMTKTDNIGILILVMQETS